LRSHYPLLAFQSGRKTRDNSQPLSYAPKGIKKALSYAQQEIKAAHTARAALLCFFPLAALLVFHHNQFRPLLSLKALLSADTT